MPSNDMTPQQRAVKVYELLLERPHKVAEIAREIGIGHSGVYELLKTFSGRDGIPISNKGGYWFLVPGYELATVFKIYQRIKAASVASDDNVEDEIALTVNTREARIILALLERTLPPMP